MRSAQLTYAGVNYANMSHQVNKADKRASAALTPGVWTPLKEVIDNTTNEDIGTLADTIAADKSLKNEEKAAVMDYMGHSMALRGFNLGLMAQERGEGAEQDKDTVEANRSYMEGYSAATGATPEQLHEIKLRYDYKRKRMEGILGAEGLERLDSEPVEGLSAVMADTEMDAGTKDAVRQYVNFKMAYDGMMKGVTDDMDEQVARSDAWIGSFVNKDTGSILPATLKTKDEEGNDKHVYILKGNVAVNGDGTINAAESDGSIIVKDAQTGVMEFLAPSRLMSVGGAVNPELAKQNAALDIRQKHAREKADQIDGVLPFKPGDTYTVDNGQGEAVQLTIVGDAVDEKGNPVEGGVVVQTADGQQSVMERSAVQAMADAAGQAHMAQEEENGGMTSGEKGEETDGEVPVYSLNDRFIIYNNEGEPVRGTVTGISDDGIEIETEEPVDGSRVQLVPKGWLDERVQELSDQEGKQLWTRKEGTTPTDDFKDIKPVGTGIFGNIYNQFKGKAKAAINFLKRIKGGEAVAALHHKEIGDISLVWGNEEMGLGHILTKHPHAVDDLQNAIDGMHVVQSSDNRIILESETHKAVVSNDWYGKPTGQWLLTAYEKKGKGASDGSIDIDSEPQSGKQNGTAPLQSPSSEGKGTNNNDVPQTDAQLSALERIPKDEEGNPLYEQADADTAWDALVEQAEADGDADMAQEVADDMVADKEAALKKLKKQKPNGGRTPAEKFAAIKKHNEDIAQAEADLAQWRKIAGTRKSRERSAEEEQRRAIAEAAAKRKAEEEKLRADAASGGQAAAGAGQAERGGGTPGDGGGIPEQGGRKASDDSRAGGDSREELQGKGGREIPQASEKQGEYTLSSEHASNGEPFYQDANGNIDLADIPQEVFDAIGYSKAPFRLTPSMILHVIKSHGKELGTANVDEIVRFVLDVMNNFDHVRLGYDGALIFSIENGRRRTGKRAVTVLINSDNGQFYGLKSSGYESIPGLNKRLLLWERGAKDESSSTDAASASVSTSKSSLSGEQSGSASHQSESLKNKVRTEQSSPEGGGSSISHAANAAPAISLQSRDDGKSSSSGRGTTEPQMKGVGFVPTLNSTSKGSAESDKKQGKSPKNAENGQNTGGKEVRGRKQVVKGLEKLRAADAKGDILGMLGAVNTIEKNVRRGDAGAMTAEEREYVDSCVRRAAQEGYKIVDLEGQQYNEGMKVIADFVEDESLKPGEQVVRTVRKPQINKDGKMVQAAEIVVAQSPYESESDYWQALYEESYRKALAEEQAELAPGDTLDEGVVRRLVDFNDEGDLYMSAETRLNELMGGKGNVDSEEYAAWYAQAAREDPGEGIPSLPQIIGEIGRRVAAKGEQEKGSKAKAQESFLNAVKALYAKGKEAAAKLYSMKFFNVAKTPDFMKELGLSGERFTIRYGVIARHFGKDGSHNLSEDEWTQLPEALAHPFAITKYYQDENKEKQKGYRLYTNLRLSNGSYVVVSAEVKNIGRNIEINAINTIFGRDSLSEVHDELVYVSETITPEQQSLLNGNNPHQYPAARESSTGKGSSKSGVRQKKAAKKGAEPITFRLETDDVFFTPESYKMTHHVKVLDNGDVEITFSGESIQEKNGLVSRRKGHVEKYEDGKGFIPISPDDIDYASLAKEESGTSSQRTEEEVRNELSDKLTSGGFIPEVLAYSVDKITITSDGRVLARLNMAKGTIVPLKSNPLEDAMPLSLSDLREAGAKPTNKAEGDALAKVADGTMFRNNNAGGHAVAVVVGSEVKDGVRRYLLLFAPSKEDADGGLFFGEMYYSEDELNAWMSDGRFTPLQPVEEAVQPKPKGDLFQDMERIAKEEEARQAKKRKAVGNGKPKNSGQFGLVSDERMEELKKKLRGKLRGQMNMGIDPEILAIGMELAAGHIDRGIKKFADFAKVMIDDLGDAIRPYLKAFYNGARDLPEVQASGLSAEMDTYEEVSRFDVANFDKTTVSALATAEQVVKEQEVQKQAEEAKEMLTDERNKRRRERKLRPATKEDINRNSPVFYNGERNRIMVVVTKGAQTGPLSFSEPEISSVLLTDGRQVKLEELQVEDESLPDEKTDKQGNPLDADGRLKVERVASVGEITDKDFMNPTRNVELPQLPRKVEDAIGTGGKPVVIKKNIFERNHERHSDISPAESRGILRAALYSPDLYGQNQKAKRPYNWVVINTKGADGQNRLVLLEVNEGKDNVEIVHWHYTDERGINKIRRQAEREDGQLLILPSEGSEEVGALSDPTLNLSSEGKDKESPAEKQAAGGESPQSFATGYKAGDKVEYSTNGKDWVDAVVVDPNDPDGIVLDTGLAPVVHEVAISPDQIRPRKVEAPELKLESKGKKGASREKGVPSQPKRVEIGDLFADLYATGSTKLGDHAKDISKTKEKKKGNGRKENSRADNSGTELGRKELPDTEHVESGTPLQDTERSGQGERMRPGNSGGESGTRPQYDVNKEYTNEEIDGIVSSVTDIVDGKVVITGEVTDDMRAVLRQYKSGGVAKKGRGILDEYYTDGKIVDAVNMIIAPYFKSGEAVRALEPSVGVGSFIAALRGIPTSQVVAFEINETTARIAKALYPQMEVNLRSFETEFIDDNGRKKPMPDKFGVVIGNPPYGSHRGFYKGLGEEGKIARYEDYFVKRSLDVLEEGGILAMVLPSSWMDRHSKFGGYTIEAAYRLPSGAFEATQVGTDIVVLRKDGSVPVTEHAPYFEQHPERVLGEVKQRRGRFGKMESYVQGDIDAAIEAIGREQAERLADKLGIEPTGDNLNGIQSAIEETGSADNAEGIVGIAMAGGEPGNPSASKPSKAETANGKYKVTLNRGAEVVPASLQFPNAFSEEETAAFADAGYDGTLKHPERHWKYANYIDGKYVHDFYYAEGDIYSKLAQLEQDKDYIVKTYGQDQYEKQKLKLESVLPRRKGLNEITISPNTAFVKNLKIDTGQETVSLKDMFIEFCRKLPYQAFGGSSSWEVTGYVNNEQVYGSDKERNQLVRERRKRVANDLFVKFLNEELPEKANSQVVTAFNREYNSVYRPDYSQVPIFSSINKDFKGKPLKLTSVQLAGIGRMTVKGVGVLAHEVGFGKTLSGVLAMHEAMNRGFAKKPLIVVPNDNILQQWVDTIKEVLPSATVNELGNLGAKYDLTGFKINDGEFTIVTYEGLKAMTFSDETYDRLADRFSYITEDLHKHQSERDRQKEAEKRNEMKGRMKRGTKASYGFEDFGFDWLTVDEVHNANHIVSKVRLDKSVASDFRSQSQRTSDLGMKTWLAAQYIQEMNNGRNVLLLSATPFTNKPLEYYSILSLVANDMLRRKGFFNVDQFFSTFMEADNDLEIAANGRPVQKTNVRRFRNNGLFQQLLSEFIDIKGEEDNPDLVRPERHNKEYKIEQNQLTADAMAAVQDLLGSNDTVLQGIGHARAAAFSPYASDQLGLRPKDYKAFVEDSPKIEATVRMIEQNRKDRPDAGQIIYSEVGVEFFPLIRDYLVKASGFKPGEVRIITGATSNKERVDIQTAFNKGEAKVVIGSPAIKEGLNLQGNTTDMYILSLPWNFTQLRQIEGRGWRQGNRWENIRINYMLTNDSIDVFMLQRLQVKQGLYNEAMKKGSESLDVSDIDTAELKTALITDPSVRAEIGTVQERGRLQQKQTQVKADLSFVMRKYDAYNKLLESRKSQENIIGMYRDYAKRDPEYWNKQITNEQDKLHGIERKIEEERLKLQKRGVDVDGIRRQTEQAENEIASLKERIDNLEEYQKELTEKYRREDAAKAKERKGSLTAYLKEREAENKSGFYRIRPENKVKEQRIAEGDVELTEEEAAIRDAVVERLRAAGIEVIDDVEAGQKVLDEANEGEVRMSAKKKRALETASLGTSPRSLTVVSSADGAKVLKNLDTLIETFEESETQPKTFVGDLAKALGASTKGSSSQYATFETKNGAVVTIRIANHNASTERMDDAGRGNAISIVVTPKRNEGIQGNGEAHIVEFYYNSIKLRKAEGKPLAEIVRSIKQALYSGEFKDTTGLAERQEVNVPETLRMNARRRSKEAEKRLDTLRTIDEAVSFVTGKPLNEVKAKRQADERRIKAEAKELYEKVLAGDFNDVTLRLLNNYLDHVTPNNPYRRPLSKRLPQKVLRRMGGAARANEVDALFSRICEGSVGTSGKAVARDGAGRVVEKKNELLKKWAIATGHWHTDLSDFTDDKTPIGKGKDSDVYMSKDGKSVIKVSKGKDKSLHFAPDIDAVALFNYVFPYSQYEILGYGEIDGKFVKFLRQPFVDFSQSAALSVEERTAYMSNLGFKPINAEHTAFSNGTLVVADLQKGNIVRDKDGNVRIIDADVKLHTKDVGGNYSYSPVETDTELPDNKVREHRVYHGSGADFDTFDHSHMGEGEGIQSYGWGTYVTEDKDIAYTYAASTGGKQAGSGLPQRIFYTVEIPDDTGGNYLDWDKPVTKEQQGRINGQLRSEGIEFSGEAADFWNMSEPSVWDSGEAIYEFLNYYFSESYGDSGSHKQASQFLSRAGFTGIKYSALPTDVGREDGAKNYVIFNEGDLKITDRVRFFRTAGGEAYGFTVGGKIYIDPRIATAETPIHEYAHLWASALRQGNPEEWQNVVALMKDTPVWNEVKRRYPELTTDDELADEVLATYSGRRGAERLRDEARKVAQGNGSVMDKAAAVSAIERVKEALRRFWKDVADFLHIHYTTAEEVADRVMRDLLEGVNPSQTAKENELGEVNERYNEEITRYQNGQMDKNEMFHLGNPHGVMRMFLPDLPIVMRPRVMNKASNTKHNVDASSLENLPRMISTPIFVFKRSGNALGILTEIKDRDGLNVCVAVELNKKIQDGGLFLEVNDIRSIHGRNAANLILPIIYNDTLVYADKEKGLSYLSSASYNYQQEIDKKDLDSAANIVRNFRNPQVSEENFREGDGVGVGNVQNAADEGRMVERVRELAAKLNLGNVETVADASTLDGKRRKAKGFYNKRTGKITIVVPNHGSVEDIEQTLLHEAVAHYGLRKLFGNRFDEFLDKVYINADTSIRKEIAAMAARRGWDFRTATEEYLAGLAERTDFENAKKSGWWQNVKRLFADMLESLGFGGMRLSDNELRYVLWRSYENLKDGGRGGILEEAVDVAKQYELKVGNYAERTKNATLEEVNARFNEELEKQIKGELPDGYVYQMGKPGSILLSTGILDLPIQMSASRLKAKSTSFGHNFELSEIRDLVKALQHPMAIFAYGDKSKAQNIIVPIQKDGKNFIVGLSLNPTVGGRKLEVNSIRNVFPKNNSEWLNWINQGKALYLDKEKIQNLIDQQRTILADVEYLDLDSAAKVVENFENPNTEGGNRSDDILFRDGDGVEYGKALARDTFERRMRSGMYQMQEALQDSMLSLKVAMEAIYKAEGRNNTYIEDVAGFENAYLGENRLSSVDKAECDAFANLLFKPLLEEVGKLAKNAAERAELTDYMMAKHGLERNRVMAGRDAKAEFEKYQKEHPNGKQTLQDFISKNRQRDYAGLTALTEEEDVALAETAAQQIVDDYEGEHDTSELWQKVNAVTDATLSKAYESGLMSKKTYEDVKSMYEFYIPLRGFDETTSDEAYAYLADRHSAFNAPIKTAKGRKSKADDPFANMEAMAESSIMQGNRNTLVKQKFLNFALNHPSDLVSVSELWLQYDDVNDEWKPVFPDNIDSNDSPADVERKMHEFEERMQQLAETEPDKYKKGKDAVNIPYRVVESRDLHQHQVIVKRGGKDYVITVNGNPRLAQALNGQTNPDNDASGTIGTILKGVEKVNRSLSALYTTKNPDFIVSNFMRDMLYSNTMVWVKESLKYAARFHVNVMAVSPARMKVLFAKHRNGKLDMKNGTERMFHQFMMNGGETGYANIRDIEKRKSDLKRELKKYSGRMPVGKAWDLLGEQFDELNRSVENCARFAAFMTSRQMGRSIDRSVWDAKDISVNFNKKGSGAKFLGANGQTWFGNTAAFTSGAGRHLYVFWNAAIQGTTNFGRQAARHPARAFTAMASMFLLGALMSAIGGGDDGDDDGKDSYYNLPEYVRRSSIIFRAGDQWVSIPLPVEYRAVYGMGEMMTSVMSGKQKLSDGELACQIAAQMSQVMPIDIMETASFSAEGKGWRERGLNVGVSLAPSALRPIGEVMVNRSWTGMPIYKDTYWNKNAPEWTKAYSGANKQLVALSAALNGRTGGDKYSGGAADINPAVVEHLLTGYFGGVASTVDKLVKMGETAVGTRDYNPRDFLILNRVVKKGDERTEYRALNDNFSDYMDRFDKMRSRYSAIRGDMSLPIGRKIDMLGEFARDEEFRLLYVADKDFQKGRQALDAYREMGDEQKAKEMEGRLLELKRRTVNEMERIDGKR